ncbi:hypothetical protein BofuT4_P013150.1 [Botrytis cinerea T4]|uniref:Uncharacterized protein n=1 Tax=Botryotinia fuckeliana (strain T4) TaxID=999810 RepID=G2XR38_BOTF4|nr:hypothetical protein BofuT4_P013150.1 [Botrytis cinerea T4]
MYNRRTHIRYERLASATTVNNYRNKRTSLLTYHIIKAITRSSIGPSLDLHNQQTKCCTEINNQTAIDSSALDSLLHLSNGRPLRASKTSLTYTIRFPGYEGAQYPRLRSSLPPHIQCRAHVGNSMNVQKKILDGWPVHHSEHFHGSPTQGLY